MALDKHFFQRGGTRNEKVSDRVVGFDNDDDVPRVGGDGRRRDGHGAFG